MLALQSMTRDEIGAKEESLGKAVHQMSDRLAPRRRFAHLPFGGAGVEIEVGISFQQSLQVIGMLDVATHVGADPNQVGKQFEHAP
jgi:hypothetical protein